MKRAAFGVLAVSFCAAARAGQHAAPVQITFQNSSGNALTPGGWLYDNGDAYDGASRGYGWVDSSDVPTAAEGNQWRMDGADPVNPDPLYNGTVFFSSQRKWWLDIANGVYKVTVCCGDPLLGTSNPDMVELNGRLVLDFFPRAGGQFREEWAIVEITGNRLEITKPAPNLIDYPGDSDRTDLTWITVETAGEQFIELRQGAVYTGTTDTYITEQQPTTAPAGDEYFFAGTTSGNIRRAFLKFDLATQIPGGYGISLAQLRLMNYNSDIDTAALEAGFDCLEPDQDWDSAITWDTANAISGTVIDTYIPVYRVQDTHNPYPQWYSWDVTVAARLWPAARNWGVTVWKVQETELRYGRWRSSEYAADETERPTLYLALEQNPNAPVASIDEPTADPLKSAENEVESFTGSGTDADGHSIVLYIWDWKDGSQDYSTDPTVTHAWTTDGTYAVELRVVDELGGVSAPATVNVWVRAPGDIPPDASIAAIDLAGQVTDGGAFDQAPYLSVAGTVVPVDNGDWSASDVPAAPTETIDATVTITCSDASGNEATLELVIGVQDL